MKNIVLVIHRKPIAQRLLHELRDKLDINLIYEAEYEDAILDIYIHNAKLLLIEAMETGYYDLDYCLKLCISLRKEMPSCKIILMCSEQNTDNIQKVIRAKEEDQIHDFVFYDTTIEYLASKLISL